jgi:titin
MRLPLWHGSNRCPSSKPQPRRPARPPRFRPHVEVLEGRWLPSTFLVTTTDDAGAGSLRQAILDANATPGTNEIDFAIGDGGTQTIRPRSSPLPDVTHSVIIDGTTQPGFTGSPLIDLDGGPNAYRIGANGLMIHANNSTIRGLAITNFSAPDDPCTFLAGIVILGNGNVVQGNYLGTDVTGTRRMGNSIGVLIEGSNNQIGGTTAAERNLISGNDQGVSIWSGSNNVMLGNYIGTDVTGTASLGNFVGLDIGGSNNLIGGTAAGARNVISGNQDAGLKIEGVGARVQGNYIGTDTTGTRALGNQEGVIIAESNSLIGGTEAGAGNLISGNRWYGVEIRSRTGNVVQGNLIGTDVTGTRPLGNAYGLSIFGPNNLIGGTEAGAGNVISGNGWDGVYISSPGGGNLVQGNHIGTDVTGTQPLGNGRHGVHIDRYNNNTIGGEAPGAGNTIAFSGGDGVLVDRGNGNAILGNAIFANGNLGIELVNGANHNQAAPVITSATTDGSSVTIQGTLTSTPNTTFTLEIFATSPGDPSGGQRFLSSVLVTTDADGNASFTVTFATAFDPGMCLAATATDPTNNTSQFSAPVEVTG